MAKSGSTKSAPSPEATVAAALRAAASGLIATAASLNALADCYVPSANEATPTSAAPAAAGKPAASEAAPIPSLDAMKGVLVKLIDNDGGNRTRLETIIAKVTGKVCKIADIPETQRAEVIRLAEEAMASKPAAAGDDL